jgi:hypothetical protein
MGLLFGKRRGCRISPLITLGTDPKENTTPLCRCPATGPKRKHYLPIVVAKQQTPEKTLDLM